MNDDHGERAETDEVVLEKRCLLFALQHLFHTYNV